MSNSKEQINEMIDTILKHEGGFVNDPDDPGGATNRGVTIGTYSKWLGKPATVQDVKEITEETAREIYELNYLVKPRINELPEILMPQMFDISINSGPKNAIKMLQRLINLAGFGVISVDGVLGPDTRNRASTMAGEMEGYAVNALVEERIKFYNKIVDRRPASGKFLKGWLRRAKTFKVTVE